MSLVVENTWTDEARAAAQEAKKAHIHSQIALASSKGLGTNRRDRQDILHEVDRLDTLPHANGMGVLRSEALPHEDYDTYRNLEKIHEHVAQFHENKARETKGSKQQKHLNASELHRRAAQEHSKAAGMLQEHAAKSYEHRRDETLPDEEEGVERHRQVHRDFLSRKASEVRSNVHAHTSEPEEYGFVHTLNRNPSDLLARRALSDWHRDRGNEEHADKIMKGIQNSRVDKAIVVYNSEAHEAALIKKGWKEILGQHDVIPIKTFEHAGSSDRGLNRHLEAFHAKYLKPATDDPGELGFHHAIKASPHDDTPKSAYHDWLMDRGHDEAASKVKRLIRNERTLPQVVENTWSEQARQAATIARQASEHARNLGQGNSYIEGTHESNLALEHAVRGEGRKAKESSRKALMMHGEAIDRLTRLKIGGKAEYMPSGGEPLTPTEVEHVNRQLQAHKDAIDAHQVVIAHRESKTRNPEEHGFIHAILKEPDNNFHKTAYSDWLRDRGHIKAADKVADSIYNSTTTNLWSEEAKAASTEAKKAHIHSQIALKGSAGLGIDQPTKRAILTGIDYLGQKNTDQDDSEPPLGRSRSATPEVEHEAYKSLAGHHATVAQFLEKKASETNDSKQRQALLGAARLHWKAVHEHRKAASGLLEHTTETLGRSTIADKVIEGAHNSVENAFLRSSTPELAHQKSLEAIAASRKAGWSLESRGPQITEASSGGEHGEAGSLHLHMIGRHEDVADMLDKHPSKESQELALSHREAAKAHRIAADHHLTIYDPPSKEAIERHTLNSDTSRDDLGRFASIEATTHALRASGNIQTLDKNAAVDTALHKVRQMAKRVQSGGRASELDKGSRGYKGHGVHYRALEKAHQQATNAHYAAIGKDTPPEIESKHLEAASRHYTAANLAGQAALQQEQVGNNLVENAWNRSVKQAAKEARDISEHANSITPNTPSLLQLGRVVRDSALRGEHSKSLFPHENALRTHSAMIGHLSRYTKDDDIQKSIGAHQRAMEAHQRTINLKRSITGSPEELGFLHAIHSEPENQLHKKVYSDWLRDRGHIKAADKLSSQVGNVANPLGVQNAKKQPHDSLKMTPEKACLILKDGEANGYKLSKAQRGMFGAKCGERTENRIGLAPIKPRRATAATGGEALTRLQAQKPHVEEDEAEKDRHKALGTVNASTLGAAPQSKKEQGVKRRGIVEDEGENLEHATHGETRNDLEEEEGEEVSNALSPDARAAAITAKASREAGDKSGELLALRRLSGKNILKHFGWKISKEHDDQGDTARIFEHPKYPGHLLSHEYDREEEQGSASRGENPTDHWHHVLHTGESDHEEHTLGHGSYKSALIDYLHKFHTTDPITNHPDEHALIRGIHENPKSDMHKGVYADWLEDRGYSTQAAKVRNLIPNHGETTTNAWPEEARTAAIEARKVHQHALTLSKGLKTSIQIGKGNFKGSLSDPRWTDSKDGWPSAVSTFYAHKGTGAGHLELAKRHEELGEKASGVRKLKHMEAAEAHKDAAHAQDIVAHHLKPAAISEEKGAIEERKGRNTEYDLSRIPDHETSIAKISKHLIKPRTSLPEEHGFLQAIHDQPEEGLNRGAYADWLEEHRHPGSAHTLRGTLGLATHNAWSDAARLAAAEARKAKHLAAASIHLFAAVLHDRALLTKGSRQHSVSASTDKATEASHRAYGQSVGAFPGGNADALTKKRAWLWKGLHMDDSDITHAEVAQQHRDQAAHHLVLAEKKEPVGEVAAKKLNKRNFAGVYTGRTAGGSEWIAANAESELTENTNLDQRGAGGNGPNVPNYLTDHGWSLTHHDPTEGWAELSHQDRPGHILALDHDGSWSHENKEGEELGSGPTHATLITHIEKLRTATKPDTHNSETTMPYTRDNAINYLTTNCECWKGERGKEILNILDEDRLRILYNDMDAVQRVKEAAKDMEEEDEETFEDGNIQASDGTKGGRKTKMVKPDEPIKVVNTAVWLASAPPEIRSVVQNAIAVEQREKASYIVKLVENVSDATKKNEMATRLNKLSIPELKDMMLMLPAQSRPATINSEVNPFLPNYLGASPGATSSQLTENEQADVLDIETARLKYDTVNNARKTQTA